MTDGLPQPQRKLAFGALAIAISMAVLDGVIVALALPVIGRDLRVTPSAAIWVINAYQIAVTVALLPLAALGDMVGYKRVYWWGLALFTVASAACAGATTLPWLAAARIAQGLGAAGIMSVNIALVRFIYPKAQLGAGVGYASLVVASASVAGPSIAAVILAYAPWQGLFLVNVPLGLLAMLIGAFTLPVTPASGNKLDPASCLLNVAAFGMLIAGLTGLADPAQHRGAWALVVGGVVAGALLAWRERRLAQPMVPVDLLRMPVFRWSLLTSMSAFAAQTMAFVALPFYLHQGGYGSAAQIGLLMTPWPLATALVAPWAGRLSDRLAPATLCGAGLLLMAAGLGAIALLGPAPAGYDVAWRMALCGLGFGLFQSPNNRVIMGSAPAARSGGASGLQSLGRLLGQCGGATLVALVFGATRGAGTTLIVALAGALSLVAACANRLRRSAAAV